MCVREEWAAWLEPVLTDTSCPPPHGCTWTHGGCHPFAIALYDCLREVGYSPTLVNFFVAHGPKAGPQHVAVELDHPRLDGYGVWTSDAPPEPLRALLP